MNINEYQAKELLQKFGVATTRGKVATTPDEAEAVARELGNASPARTVNLVVKAQIHAGGRGKGTFKNGFKGGVHLVKSSKEAHEIVRRIVSNVRRLRLLHGRDQSAGGDQEGRRARARCEI